MSKSRSIQLEHLGPAAREQATRLLAEQVLDQARGAQKPVPARAPDPASFTITLRSPPPSTNNLFASTTKTAKDGHQYQGRVKTQVYRQWLAVAAAEIRTQKAPSFAGPVMVDISCERKSERADIDNQMKASLDLLVKTEVLGDDRQVNEIRCRWAQIKGCVVEITSAALPPNYLTAC